MTEPFADPERLLAGWANYGSAVGARAALRAAALLRAQRRCRPSPSTAPTTTSSGAASREMCEVAFSELIGPFVVKRAGHFLQWERAELLNRAIDYFLAELRQ